MKYRCLTSRYAKVFLCYNLMLLAISPCHANVNQWRDWLVGVSHIINTALLPKKQTAPQDSPPTFVPDVQQKPTHTTIVAVGDIMIGSSYPSPHLLPPHDGKHSFDAVKSHLVGDVVFGNLEGVLLDDNTASKCSSAVTPSRCYAFKMPTRYGKLLQQAGFNALSIANNHVGDFGDVGRQSTLNTLAQLGIHHAGLSKKPTAIFSQNGLTYGMVAFSPNTGTLSIHDIQTAKQLVQALDKQSDIVIVSFHGGAEGTQHTRLPKTVEHFFGENRGDVYAFAHAVIDAGADIVIGHGPHVTRAVEVYKKRFIAYSLGNFNTYGTFSLEGASGIAPLLRIQLTNSGEFVMAQVISIAQTKTQGMYLDKNHKAFDELKRLSDLDFVNHSLVFDNNHIYANTQIAHRQ